jgi:hypothetical protein
VKFTNLKITPKLGILVGVTLLGLCAAGVLAGYLMQREMLNGRVEQTRAIVDMARNMALGLQKQVAAGQMTKEAAIAEFSKRGNTLTFDNGNGYVFAYTMDGVAVLAPVADQIGQNRMDVDTGGRKLVRELRDGIAANGEIMLRYEFRLVGRRLDDLGPDLIERFLLVVIAAPGDREARALRRYHPVFRHFLLPIYLRCWFETAGAATDVLPAISPFTRPDCHPLQSLVDFSNKNTGLRCPS